MILSPYYKDSGYISLFNGDMLEVLPKFPLNFFDAVITDCPYELNMMGKAWDSTGISFSINTWEQVLRVLKPGGYLATFGGARTVHRITCAIEDAGFEIRDLLLWIFGSGFPKGRNISRDVDEMLGSDREKEWNTSLKPAYEPIILARKPISEKSVVKNVLRWGTGAINIGACRVGNIHRHNPPAGTFRNVYHKYGGGFGKGTDVVGRYPSNLFLSHDPNCVVVNEVEVKVPHNIIDPEKDVGIKRRVYDAGVQSFRQRKPGEPSIETLAVYKCVSNCPRYLIDQQNGITKSMGGQSNSVFRSASRLYRNGEDNIVKGENDKGNAVGVSRFFSNVELDEDFVNFFYCAKASKKDRQNVGHPTVKPTKLCEWLIKLLTPPDGIILDPFCGSGSILIVAKRLGFKSVGIEINKEYCDMVIQRINVENNQESRD